MFPFHISLGKYYLSCFPPLCKFWFFFTYNLLTVKETKYSEELKKKPKKTFEIYELYFKE